MTNFRHREALKKLRHSFSRILEVSSIKDSFMLLKNKKILLGVTGSISAYKACEIARLFVKSGADVRVVMSEAAKRFVSPLTFEALTRQTVLHEGSESWANSLNHIEAAKECDIFVIAPATANTINKLSKGIADNILLQCALACPKPILVAPAANTQMLKNHYTAGSLKMLAVNEYEIVQPQEKILACGDLGSGALAEPEEIYWRRCSCFRKIPTGKTAVLWSREEARERRSTRCAISPISPAARWQKRLCWRSMPGVRMSAM